MFDVRKKIEKILVSTKCTISLDEILTELHFDDNSKTGKLNAKCFIKLCKKRRKHITNDHYVRVIIKDTLFDINKHALVSLDKLIMKRKYEEAFSVDIYVLARFWGCEKTLEIVKKNKDYDILKRIIFDGIREQESEDKEKVDAMRFVTHACKIMRERKFSDVEANSIIIEALMLKTKMYQEILEIVKDSNSANDLLVKTHDIKRKCFPRTMIRLP